MGSQRFNISLCWNAIFVHLVIYWKLHHAQSIFINFNDAFFEAPEIEDDPEFIEEKK